MSMLKTSILLGAAALLIALPANAADLKGEIVNAQTHAGLAAQATTIDGVHMHLHHTLNCLVGPGGAGFDATQMNPCANSGNGVIADTTDAAKKKSFAAAATEAQAGIAQSDLSTAKKTAGDVATMLKADE
jgi:hypothetical protein